MLYSSTAAIPLRRWGKLQDTVSAPPIWKRNRTCEYEAWWLNSEPRYVPLACFTETQHIYSIRTSHLSSFDLRFHKLKLFFSRASVKCALILKEQDSNIGVRDSEEIRFCYFCCSLYIIIDSPFFSSFSLSAALPLCFLYIDSSFMRYTEVSEYRVLKIVWI
jgi:hypothetical protein